MKKNYENNYSSRKFSKTVHEEKQSVRARRFSTALKVFFSENADNTISYLNVNGFAMPVRSEL